MKKGTIAVIVTLLIFIIVNAYLIRTKKIELGWQGIGIIVAAGLTLAMYSFLYKDNPVFKFAEHLYVGVANGYIISITWHQVLWPILFKPLIYEAKFILIIPGIFGLFMFSRFVPRWAWISRWSFAFVVGMGSGMMIPRAIRTKILHQINPTLTPLSANISLWGNICLLTIFVGVLCVLVYFFFSVEHKGVVGKVSRIGIWFLMISFGAYFGYTVMARISLLIGRMQFLLFEWLKIPK